MLCGDARLRGCERRSEKGGFVKKFFGVLMVVAGTVSVACGHPASDVTIANTGEALTITAAHGTRDAAVHYIDNVTIRVGGKPAVIQHCARQTSATAQTLTYVIPGLKAGDSIQASTHCSKGGHKTVKAQAQ